MHDDGVFGPVGLLADDVDELQDALDGVDRRDAVVRPRGVVQVEDVLDLVSLGGATQIQVRWTSWIQVRRTSWIQVRRTSWIQVRLDPGSRLDWILDPG